MTVTQAPPDTARWAAELPPVLRRQVDWVVSQAANNLLAAASDENVKAHTKSIPEALHLGYGLMCTHADMLDLHDDVTAQAAAEDDAALDALAVPCPRPGCTHDRGSHLNGTGSCGWCPCTGFAGEQVTFEALDAIGGAA